MARTDITKVRAILPTSTKLTDPQIQAAIDAATCEVDSIVDCASNLTAACLIQVETWLSAHTAAAIENTLSLASETDPCSGGKATYGFKFGEGVKGTPYGMKANSLSGGCLAELDKQPINIISLGTIGDDAFCAQSF